MYIKEYLPPELHHRAYITGGYAHSPSLADDVDLFILDCDGPLPLLTYPQQPLSLYQFSAGVRAVYSPSVAAQIICVSHKTIQELLDDFDITTHMVAIDADGNTIYGQYYTPSAVQVHRPLNGLTNPVRTLYRYIKLCYRYNTPPRLADLTLIQEALALHQAAQGEPTCN